LPFRPPSSSLTTHTDEARAADRPGPPARALEESARIFASTGGIVSCFCAPSDRRRGGEVMRTWRAQITVLARPAEVLEMLTLPAAVARWSPVGFDIEELDGTHLRRGTHARVAGWLAGRRVEFEVDVAEADPERLLLHARGPVGLEVEYTIAPAPFGSAVAAAITVRGARGMTQGLIARAVHLLLAVGGLEAALARLAREVDREALTRDRACMVGGSAT
jgi:hypothetical protein